MQAVQIPEGHLFRQAREEAGLSQAELARRTKIAQSLISDLESDKKGDSPRISVILKIANATGKPTSFFLGTYLNRDEIDPLTPALELPSTPLQGETT